MKLESRDQRIQKKLLDQHSKFNNKIEKINFKENILRKLSGAGKAKDFTKYDQVIGGPFSELLSVVSAETIFKMVQ